MRTVIALATILAVAAPPAEATTHKKSTKAAVAKKKTKKHAKTKHAKTKRAKTRTLVKLPRTPTVAVASYHGDGRVRYGKDNMPPGFAWPATDAMKRASAACEQEISDAGVTFQAAPPLGVVVDPIRLPVMSIGGIDYVPAWDKGPFTLDCQLVRVLVKLGPELANLGVREVHFGSIYRNTLVRVHGQRKNILSRHALGLAMDIKEFVDDSGRVANVELDYLKGDPLLHAIEDAVNRSNDFRIILTPANDPLSHADHFHIEASVDFTAFR
jgi:hypothetical protein